MKGLLHLAAMIGISSCTVSTPKLEGIWVNSYEQTSRFNNWDQHVLSTKTLTIEGDSIQIQSFYAGSDINTNKFIGTYKTSNDSISLIENNSVISKIHYSFDNDSLILYIIENNSLENEKPDTIRSVFFHYPTTIKLDKLVGVYQWNNGYQSDTIELISDSLLLSNERSSRTHKTYQTYWQTDNYIILYSNGMPYPDILFPISGNVNDFIAQSNYSKDLKFHFRRINEHPIEEVNIIGKWDLKEMQDFDDRGNDTIITFKKNTTIEITKDSIFWGPSHYSYNWDYSKKHLLCNIVSIDADNEKQNNFVTFKIINISDNQLELERLHRGTIKYTLINKNGR